MTIKRFFAFLAAILVLTCCLGVYLGAAANPDDGRTTSDVILNGNMAFYINGVLQSISPYNGIKTNSVIYNSVDRSYILTNTEGTFVNFENLDVVPFTFYLDTGKEYRNISCTYKCDYISADGTAKSVLIPLRMVYQPEATRYLMTGSTSPETFHFIAQKLQDYQFDLTVNVTDSTTPLITSYLFDKINVYLDDVLQSGITINSTYVSIVYVNGNKYGVKSDGSRVLLSGDTVQIPFSIGSGYDKISSAILSDLNYTVYLNDGVTTSGIVGSSVDYNVTNNSGFLYFSFNPYEITRGNLSLKFTTTMPLGTHYVYTGENGGFNYNISTDIISKTDGYYLSDDTITFYAKPVNGKIPLGVKVLNGSGLMLTDVAMSRFYGTVYSATIPYYSEDVTLTVYYGTDPDARYLNGYNDGFNAGVSKGYEDGKKDGYDVGYEAGKSYAYSNSNGFAWDNFFGGVFGSVVTNIIYVLSSIGFGGISLFDLISVASICLILFFIIKLGVK